MQETEYSIKDLLLKTTVGMSECRGCFLHSGSDFLVYIEWTMDRFIYYATLEKHMLPLAKQKIGHNWKFQQDNDPKHTYVYVSDF